MMDCIIALDEKTVELHKKELKKDGLMIGCNEFCDIGRNANIAQAGAIIKILGVPMENLNEEIIKEFGENKEILEVADKGHKSKENKYNLKPITRNKVTIMTGSQAVAIGAINSGMNLYFAYPMTPATGVMHELAATQSEKGHMVFESENEIAVANSGLGASFAGAKVMIGTSGGGFDLMTEALSFQGMAEIPLVVYLASRPGPGTGIPTYSSQADLNLAEHGGHGEFPRIVIAPGDPVECIEKTNEAFYLSEKYGMLSIVLSDKHLAESEFSTEEIPNKIIPINVKRKTPGEGIIKTSSYEHDKNWNTTESTVIAKKSAEIRLQRYETMKKEVNEKFEMIKIHGNKNSKNLIIGWGSNKTVILDAIDGLDYKFLQVIYTKPLSEQIKKEMEKANKLILVESNLTGQLGRLIREKTGIEIKNRILQYDGLPFTSDGLKEQIMSIKK